MKQNRAKIYAKALAEVLEKKAEGPERSRRVIANFVKLLISAGYEKKSKEILGLAGLVLTAICSAGKAGN